MAQGNQAGVRAATRDSPAATPVTLGRRPHRRCCCTTTSTVGCGRRRCSSWPTSAAGRRLPSTDSTSCRRGSRAAPRRGDLLQYLATFEHTLAVMQTAERDRAGRLRGGRRPRRRRRRLRRGALRPRAAPTPGCRSRRSSTRSATASGGASATAQRRAGRSSSTRSSAPCARSTARWRSPGSSTGCGSPNDKVVAFDLAGAETGWPPSLHAEALAFARAHHLNITIHASEPPDLELIADALAHGAHRIGHGVRLRPATRTTGRRRHAAASARWPGTCSTTRSTSRWRRRATSRSAPSPTHRRAPDRAVPARRASASASTPTTG